MKVWYSLLLSIIALEFSIIAILDKNNIRVQSWIGNAVGTFVFLLPIQILLLLLSKDKTISERKRTYCKVAVYFIAICYILGGIASLVKL